ncbi:5,6-dimethylbenzimidazole synthase [Actibacterium sp. 188UL27-1]|uniref:5,6-dimethylbenzimidazole synthase n=1 Tax=Actibacterium sp. 188UL27-1 TaxID=2786961 RepID=UPI00195A5925|nr:5,6-dimethylbenzimidazole synthase [Actibacterium sp. 188UL27-1]MBM7066235.1 5,6-dimethylbenzimidazole synthase [Actibacterium sp. 188UL27-1]
MAAFPDDFQDQLTLLMRLRRDVRRFRSDPVEEALVTHCLDAFRLAPSVGLSETWRLVRVQTPAARAAALANYKQANAAALAGYGGDEAADYSALKLSGMEEAPVHLAVFSDESSDKGRGLGAQSMPEMRRYSVVCAITLMWLRARAKGLGIGWVSILDAQALARRLDVPDDWVLVGYLCLGWPEAEGETPELETLGWEERRRDLPIETR